jgi:hypothetical protein
MIILDALMTYGEAIVRSDSSTQTQGVVSRLNDSYFCEVISIEVIDNETNEEEIKGVIINFNVRGDCSYGPNNQPNQSKLFIGSTEYSATSVDIYTKTFHQVIGKIKFLFPVHDYQAKVIILNSKVRFRYGNPTVGYTKVILQFPKHDDKICPICLTSDLQVNGDDGIFECSNCHRTKEGRHWNCGSDECKHDFCFDCLSATFVSASCNCDCQKPSISQIENDKSSESGHIRFCENCAIPVTNERSQISSCYMHCNSCNMNICRACSFHPNHKYSSLNKDRGTLT